MALYRSYEVQSKFCWRILNSGKFFAIAPLSFMMLLKWASHNRISIIGMTAIFLLDSVFHYNLVITIDQFARFTIFTNCTKIYQAPAVKLNCLFYFTENLWGPRVNIIRDLRADGMLIIDPFFKKRFWASSLGRIHKLRWQNFWPLPPLLTSLLNKFIVDIWATP